MYHKIKSEIKLVQFMAKKTKFSLCWRIMLQIFFLTESYEMLFSLIDILYIIILSNCTIQTCKLYTRLAADTLMISSYVTNTLYPDNRPAQ